MPQLPNTVDRVLRELIREIDQADDLGDLLEQCLQELSAKQARGGQYFTPRDLVRLMVAAADPQNGQRMHDPVCGSAGLLIEAERYVRERTGRHSNLVLTGRDLHAETLQIAQMNLTTHGIEADLDLPADSLAQPTGQTYDIVLANPPFNMGPWSADLPAWNDPRWLDGTPPPRDNGNFAWILHVAHSLAPGGRAVVLMADGAASSAREVERRIREQLVRRGLIECVIALPPGLFSHTRAACCLWLLSRGYDPHWSWEETDERSTVLFIDARMAAEKVAGTAQRRLAPDRTEKILGTLAAWRGTTLAADRAETRYHDEPGWCSSRSLKDIADHEWDLLPHTYVSERPERDMATHQRVEKLTRELFRQFDEAHTLERRLRSILDEQ
ncbi:N-6 DNA methylase [Marinactinospora rubrisoli]|uniref:N-6 DNA methylase n=1 Tax=Marinactinospora rubrisoli TaxID=2715399 RepID=A0ABW2K8E0_9ACTN